MVACSATQQPRGLDKSGRWWCLAPASPPIGSYILLRLPLTAALALADHGSLHACYCRSLSDSASARGPEIPKAMVCVSAMRPVHVMEVTVNKFPRTIPCYILRRSQCQGPDGRPWKTTLDAGAGNFRSYLRPSGFLLCFCHTVPRFSSPFSFGGNQRPHLCLRSILSGAARLQH